MFIDPNYNPCGSVGAECCVRRMPAPTERTLILDSPCYKQFAPNGANTIQLVASKRTCVSVRNNLQLGASK